MSPVDAAKLLDLPVDASPEQLEARFLELRRKLEDKIAKAPTPGLQAKYRESLAQITTAFETLTLAADSSLLPMLQKQEPVTKEPGSTTPSPAGSPLAATTAISSARAPTPPARRKSGNKEFVLVAVLGAALLAGGGWWVMKTRAENAEKVRVEAEAKAEAARVAEARRKAEEAEKIRLAEAEKQERERKDKLTTRLRTRLAELRLEWEIIEKEPRSAERTLNETKSALRGEKNSPEVATRLTAESQAQAKYVAWLEGYLERHPAKLARVRAEELLSARDVDAASAAIDELAAAITATGPEIKRQRDALLALEGSLRVTSTPSGLTWELTDSFGRRKTGKTPATVPGVSPGPATVIFQRPGFKDVTANAFVSTGATAPVEGVLVSQEVIFRAESDVQFYVGNTLLGRGTAQWRDAAPKAYTVELRRNNFPPYRTNFEVKQASGTITYSYSFDELAAETLSCNDCSGSGRRQRQERCYNCNGRGTLTCNNCDGRGYFNPPTIDPAVAAMRFNCRVCGGDGRVDCGTCDRGRIQHQDNCSRCGGDGRVSRLQLAQ